MDTREQKEARLAELKASLMTVEGSATEVYSRIVGYYRSVRNWNAGKREEFGRRLEFAFPSGAVAAPGLPVPASSLFDPVRSGAPRPSAGGAGTPSSWILFSRAACPNCPPVRDSLSASGLPGVIVDVDTAEGLSLAGCHEVQSTPTAILLGADGSELSRAYTRRQLESAIPSPAGNTAPELAAPELAAPELAAAELAAAELAAAELAAAARP